MSPGHKTEGKDALYHITGEEDVFFFVYYLIITCLFHMGCILRAIASGIAALLNFPLVS